MITLLIDNYNLTGQEESYITADVAAGVSALVFKNGNNFNSNDYVLMEQPGTENAEVVQIDTVTVNNITLKAATSMAHDENTVVTKLPYNQIKLYRSTTKGGTYSLVTTVNANYDEDAALINDAAGTVSSWYKATYYNSTTTDETALASASPVRGGVEIIADPTSFYANSYVTNGMANDYFNNRTTSDEWFDVSTMQQGQSLLEATTRIDSFRYKGDLIWYKQKLQFPRTPYTQMVSGVADSGSKTTLVDAQLANLDLYQDNEWEFAGLRIINGTNQKETRLIEKFDVTTGTLTVHTDSEDFTSDIDTTSQYELVEKVPDDIRDAQCELALYILKQKAARNSSRDPNIKSEKVGDYSVTYKDTDVSKPIPDYVNELLVKYINKMGVLINNRGV